MEFQKIGNFLDTTSDDKDLPIFITKKWVEVHDQSEKHYNPNKEIRIKTSILRSDLCNFSDAYIVVEGTIALPSKYFLVLKTSSRHVLKTSSTRLQHNNFTSSKTS